MGNVALRRVRACAVAVALALLAPAGGGCTFARVRTNRGVEALETAWIRPGETTYGEVLARLGLPPPVGRADDAPAWLSSDALHYVSMDTRIFRLELGYVVTPLFERTRSLPAHDILIRFREGVVCQVSRVRRRGGKAEVLEFREAAP